jgi:hypothetical protein
MYRTLLHGLIWNQGFTSIIKSVKLNSNANKKHLESGIHRIINIYKLSPYLTE